MQALALEHLEEFDGGTIIISPMNILPNKVKGYATRVHKKKGKVLVDPQLYYPRQYQKKVKKIENNEEIEKIVTINYNSYRYVYVYDISQTKGGEEE